MLLFGVAVDADTHTDKKALDAWLGSQDQLGNLTNSIDQISKSA